MHANTLTYDVILYWSNDDQAFIAEMPQLPGCAADGATMADALSNVRVITLEWLETARELGHAIPEPRGRLQHA